MRHLLTPIIGAALASGLGVIEPPAAAAPHTCALVEINLTADACGDPFTGALIAEDPVGPKPQVDALARLGVNFDPVDWSAIDLTKIKSAGGPSFEFARALNAKDSLPSEIFDVLTLNLQGASSGVWYPGGGTKALPEPATWAMMLMGFAVTGIAIQLRRRWGNHLAQIA